MGLKKLLRLSKVWQDASWTVKYDGDTKMYTCTITEIVEVQGILPWPMADEDYDTLTRQWNVYRYIGRSASVAEVVRITIERFNKRSYS